MGRKWTLSWGDVSVFEATWIKSSTLTVKAWCACAHTHNSNIARGVDIRISGACCLPALLQIQWEALWQEKELTSSSDHWAGRGMYKYHSHTENSKEKDHWAKPWMKEMHTGKWKEIKGDYMLHNYRLGNEQWSPGLCGGESENQFWKIVQWWRHITIYSCNPWPIRRVKTVANPSSQCVITGLGSTATTKCMFGTKLHLLNWDLNSFWKVGALRIA